MIFSYLKITWRNLLKNRNQSLINILGLALGMACCILIALYAWEEMSYDDFHEDSDRIVVVGHEGAFGQSLQAPTPLAPTLRSDLAGISTATRIAYDLVDLSRDGNEFISVEELKYAEPQFFEIFSFPLIAGDEQTALVGPNRIVLTEQLSTTLFGDENPVGQTVQVEGMETTELLEVTGVIAAPPVNSSIQFDALVSFQTRSSMEYWGIMGPHTYVKMNQTENIQDLQQEVQDLVARHMGGSDTGISLIPLADMHLSTFTGSTGFTGDSSYLFIFISIAIFILLIACVNYINLSTARVSSRMREIGVRKTMGGNRTQLALQFLGESVMVSMIAFLLGLLMVELAIPGFNSLFGTHLSWTFAGPILIWLGMGAVAVGMVFGLYPALYLSRFSPSVILKNRIPATGSGASLRKGLVVTQFAIALVLICGSLTIFQQLKYAQEKDLGFEDHRTVVSRFLTPQPWNLREDLLNQVRAHSTVEEATVAMEAPGMFGGKTSADPERFSSQAESDRENVIFHPAEIYPDYLEMLKIDLVTGRDFRNRSGDNGAFILNREGARQLGWTPEEAVGKPFHLRGTEGEIIGVTENFHIESMVHPIQPVVLSLIAPDQEFNGGMLIARFKSDQVAEGMSFLEDRMAEFAPDQPFDYEFLDEKFDAMYRTEFRFGRVAGSFTLIAIFVACLGLYGLAAFSAERRVKEIGIRKVLGATVANIIALLSRDFLKLVAVGFLIAIPFAWYGINQWLANFAYRIEPGIGLFALAGGAALLIALATVSWQSIRAALANPVDSLRSE